MHGFVDSGVYIFSVRGLLEVDIVFVEDGVTNIGSISFFVLG